MSKLLTAYGLNIKVLRKQGAIVSAVNMRMAATANNLCVKKFCVWRPVGLQAQSFSIMRLIPDAIGMSEATVCEENETKKARRCAEPRK